MEKCVFVGYPSGYKGWTFYNPSTQKYIICEHAEFDECVFPGLAKYKATSPVNLTSPNSIVAPTFDLLLNLGGDSDDDKPTLTSMSMPPPTFAPLDPPVDLPAPEEPSIEPVVPPIIQAALRRTSRVSCHPGEWWKVKHQVEPPTQPPVI